MTEKDYMKLNKKILVKLLVERDNNCIGGLMWRKRNDFSYPVQFCGILITGGDTTTLPVLVADGYEIPIKYLLEKLPKEE